MLLHINQTTGRWETADIRPKGTPALWEGEDKGEELVGRVLAFGSRYDKVMAYLSVVVLDMGEDGLVTVMFGPYTSPRGEVFFEDVIRLTTKRNEARDKVWYSAVMRRV